jgi:hypothetical protein
VSGPQDFLLRADARDVAGSAGRELAEGLLLVRTSTMKMLRLQLAIERRDRGIALQTLDELVDLDSSLAALLGRMPCEGLERLLGDADEQRARLIHEKFGLGAGLLRRSDERAPRPWTETAEQEPSALVAAEPSPIIAAHSHPEVAAEEAPSKWRSVLLFGAVLFALVSAAIAAFLFLGWEPDRVREWLEGSFTP